MIDRTSDGVEIKIGLRVMTNDLEWGTVTHEPDSYNPGWWGVTQDGDSIRYTKDPKGA